MMLKLLIKDDRGSVLVYMGLLLMGLIAMVSLVIDMGNVYFAKRHLQKTVDSAALSGAQELPDRKSAAEQVAKETVLRNGEDLGLTSITFIGNNQLRVQITRDVPLSFARVFGFANASLEASATAAIQSMNEAAGVAPLGISDSIKLEYGSTYRLKVDNTESDTGNFGILALGGPGADRYYENLLNGYNQPIKINDVFETQTGNIAGKTMDAIRQRLEMSKNYPECEETPYARECPRILLVPTYTANKYSNRQLSEIKVTGFAYFYITQMPQMNGNYIIGQFVQRAGTGYGGNTTVNRGAYAIRLIE